MNDKSGDKYVVVHGGYDNDTLRNDFIEAIGTYNDAKQAYGAALIRLCETVKYPKTEKITPLFQLEGQTGYGMEIMHDSYTDYCYVLFTDPDEWSDELGAVL